MKVILRLTRPLYDKVRTDLARPHPFAGERVGFLFAKLVDCGRFSQLVLFTTYRALADDRYIRDPLSGARIDSQAIRGAMQEVLDLGEGVFHVHAHDGPGQPHFSRMDREELPRLISSFRVIGPECGHGIFLLSTDACTAMIWLPGSKEPVESARITIVGQPMRFMDGGEA